ncbi:MAG: hypothetical protein ACOC7N_01780 [Chloroflexota bacterium]
MAIRHPIEYQVSPDQIDRGLHWVTLRLKNVGDEPLTGLDVRLHSMDDYSIAIAGEGNYIETLPPGEAEEIPYRVSADLTGRVYASVEGWRGEERFEWESPGVMIKVGKAPAELVSVFALTEPYPSPGEVLRCEAIVRGLEPAGDLRLEFWAQQPRGEFEQLVTLENLQLSAGDENNYATEITPEQEGEHVVHAYLYDGERRIGHATDTVYVGQTETPPLERPELPPEE